MTRPDNNPNRGPDTPLTAEQSEERAIQAAARWVQSGNRERFFMSNALWAIKLWDGAYKPEATLLRRSVALSEGSSIDNIRAFQQFYVAEVTDHIHAQKGPVVVAELMVPVDETHPAHNAQCAHCTDVLPGATAKIVGAKDPTDLTITLDRFHGNVSDSTVKVADKPKGEVISVELTDMDLHMLGVHYQEEGVTDVLKSIFQLAPYVPIEGSVDLELPYFRTPDQQ